MKREELVRQIKRKVSMLCVGLDPDPERIPERFLSEADPVLAFLKNVVDETADFCVAFKPNLAFFEADGWRGMQRFETLVNYIKTKYPEQFIIADAKRGDIGNTARMYAKAYFEQLSCDAITLSPYMGCDSIEPYLEFPNKWVIVLGLTSNAGAVDLELEQMHNGELVYEHCMRKTSEHISNDRLMFVVGATRPEILGAIRQRFPEHFFLVPGVGAQGGSVEAVCAEAATTFGGLLINASRSILYPDNQSQEPHRLAAWAMQRQMAPYISLKGFVASTD